MKKAVLFDLDGVILDSGFDGFEWAYQVRKRKLEQMGKDVNLSGYEQLVFDVESFQELENLMQRKDLTHQEVVKIEKAVIDRKLEMVRNGEMQLFGDVKPALDRIDSSKAVVSNAYRSFLDEFVEVKNLERYFSHWFAPSISELRQYHSIMKPETDLLQTAMKKTGSKDAVMVGDSKVDVKAAENAGIESVFVDRSGGKMEEADYSINSLSRLTEIID